MNDRLTEGVGKSDNRGQEFGASGEKIKFEIKNQSILKLASKYDNCMPFGWMVSCFDPVRDKLYLDIRTPFDPGFKNKMAELQLASPEMFNKVQGMEISNASWESSIIGSFQSLIKVGPDRRVWPAWTIGLFPSLSNLTLLPGSCSHEMDEGKSIRDFNDRVFGPTSQEQRDAKLIHCLTKSIELGVKYFGQGSIPKIAFKHWGAQCKHTGCKDKLGNREPILKKISNGVIVQALGKRGI
jgi:hypothetical protein